MIDFYPQAKQLLVDQSRVFIGALTTVPSADFSIVIHKTACNAPCTAESVANFFASDTNGASTHFIVGLDGEVVQCVMLSDGGGGNCCLEAGHDTYWDGFNAKYGNLNLFTFSIEHIDVTVDNSETPTQAQLNTSFSLVLWLCQQFGVTAARIKPHSSLDPISRALCPRNYPLDSLITYVRRNLVNPNQEKSMLDRCNSFFVTLKKATSTPTIPLAPPGTGIFNAWQSLYLKGTHLGLTSTYEYDSVDWSGNRLTSQDS